MTDPRITRYLKQRIGLDANSIGETTIRHALRRRSTALGLHTADEYWARLESSGQEQQALIEAVVVPETWFFRYPESFNAFTALALKAQATQPQPLRILSAPCSTGEEPYSIAMALLDAGFQPGQFSVDAIDISHVSIERARAGNYGKNSFRSNYHSFRERHFEARQQDFHLSERVRNLVRFRSGNLLEPAAFAGEAPYDFVFCRNLLIYFDIPTQEAALKTLLRLARPGGYFFVGPAEASLFSRHGLAALSAAQSFAFRHEFLKTLVPAKAPRPVAAPSPAVLLPRPAAKPAAVSPARPAPPKPQADLTEISHLADSGQLDEALRQCQDILSRQGPSAELHYWIGLLHDSAGRSQDALEQYRKALYLDPRHEAALVHMSTLLQTLGDVAGASRLRARAARRTHKHG
jgi:chemotaxis protein methyltransferase WspC